jgi:hypothetical protein
VPAAHKPAKSATLSNERVILCAPLGLPRSAASRRDSHLKKGQGGRQC